MTYLAVSDAAPGRGRQPQRLAEVRRGRRRAGCAREHARVVAVAGAAAAVGRGEVVVRVRSGGELLLQLRLGLARRDRVLGGRRDGERVVALARAQAAAADARGDAAPTSHRTRGARTCVGAARVADRVADRVRGGAAADDAARALVAVCRPQHLAALGDELQAREDRLELGLERAHAETLLLRDGLEHQPRQVGLREHALRKRHELRHLDQVVDRLHRVPDRVAIVVQDQAPVRRQAVGAEPLLQRRQREPQPLFARRRDDRAENLGMLAAQQVVRRQQCLRERLLQHGCGAQAATGVDEAHELRVDDVKDAVLGHGGGDLAVALGARLRASVREGPHGPQRRVPRVAVEALREAAVDQVKPPRDLVMRAALVHVLDAHVEHGVSAGREHGRAQTGDVDGRAQRGGELLREDRAGRLTVARLLGQVAHHALGRDRVQHRLLGLVVALAGDHARLEQRARRHAQAALDHVDDGRRVVLRGQREHGQLDRPAQLLVVAARSAAVAGAARGAPAGGLGFLAAGIAAAAAAAAARTLLAVSATAAAAAALSDDWREHAVRETAVARGVLWVERETDAAHAGAAGADVDVAEVASDADVTTVGDVITIVVVVIVVVADVGAGV